MAVYLSPFYGAAGQLFNDNGDPLAGGKIYSYLAGSTTLTATYTTSAGNIAHSNPIVLDGAGRVPSGEIWLTDNTTYKFVVEDSVGGLIGTYDNIPGINDLNPAVQNFTGDGSTLTFALSFAPSSENTTSVYINGVYQNKNTWSLSGLSLIFTQAPPTTSKIEVVY